MENNQITKEWIDQQRAICEAAPAGKWELSSAGYVFSEDAPLNPFAAILCSGYKAVDTGNFIVAAHDNYRAALDALEATQKEIARLTAERDAAINAIRESAIPCNEIYYAGVVSAFKAVNSVPAADVVLVVRCKDCITSQYSGIGRVYCNRFLRELPATHYCSLGMRLDGGDPK